MADFANFTKGSHKVLNRGQKPKIEEFFFFFYTENFYSGRLNLGRLLLDTGVTMHKEEAILHLST